MAHHHEQRVPKGAITGAAIVMAITIGLAALGRARENPPAELPQGASVELRVEDRTSGEVVIIDHQTDDEVWVVPTESGGFVRGVLRGVFRTRRLESVGRDAPLTLWERSDGELVLTDPETGHEVELRSFGATNYESFAQILAAAEAAR